MRHEQKQPIGFGVLLTLISALGFSVYPILEKYVFAGEAGYLQYYFGRFTIVTFFWILTTRREGFPQLTLKTWLTLWGLGCIGYSLMAGLYLTSVRFIPASLVSSLFYAYPIIVTVLSVLTQPRLSYLVERRLRALRPSPPNRACIFRCTRLSTSN